ncbi:hypothetical protein G4Y79_14360 [Phototrophicus methaneseepsis]|uniref:Leucine-binding protein domain-containing protein n=1 Tax=Phototrophicus methaneseepsis TaxID=2710758 RepID=A0A7S8E5S3_9CHLR|nr:hypothetical protein [Phototrophicus methaneseepsis]QPC80891.1 hypothetical protein G4Y79_14360 [Phototrophicus methaneseepsis]
MNSTFKIAASAFLIALLALTGCTISSTPKVPEVVLLAPFEGRYSELGYDALYAARLALSHSTQDIDLTALDDGGSVTSAVSRAKAIANSDQTRIILATGPFATTEAVQVALGNLPMLIIGGWHTTPSRQGVYILSSEELSAQLTTEQNAELFYLITPQDAIIGDERLSLAQLPLLTEDLSHVTIVSSAALPDNDFRESYLSSAEFAPEPGLLASLTYDAAAMAITAIERKQPIDELQYEGLNGPIRFENGYWADAPILTYTYLDGELVLSDD